MSGQSYSELQATLQAAVAGSVKDKDKDGDWYCWVQDFDDNTVTYSLQGEMYQADYTINGAGVVDLGKPQTVRPVTNYVPTEGKNAAPFERRSAAWGGPPVRVKSEPLTYRRDATDTSYFRDLALAELLDNRSARARLERHRAEMRVERSQFETRVNPNSTQGQGGYFDVPLWLNQYFATAPRARRVLADMIPSFPLPQGIHSLNLFRLTTGEIDVPQSDDEADPSQDEIDSAVTGTVTTVSGMGDVSLPLLEQSPAGAHLDWVIFTDLTAAYDAQLEYQLLLGSGTGENIGGLVSSVLPSANKVTDNSAVTGASLWTDMSKAGAAIGDNRNLPPEVVLMRTGRWMWLGEQGDSQNRPFITPGDANSIPDGRVDGVAPFGAMFGVPIYMDDAIPSTLQYGTGTTANQDAVVLCRPSDMMLLEGTPKTMVGLEVLSGTLQARIQLRNFVVAITNRYPSSVAAVIGAGMAYPSGF